MNKSQQLEFCLRTAIFLKREAEEAVYLHDEVADIHALLRLTEEADRRCAAIRLKDALCEPVDEVSLKAPNKDLVDLKIVLQKMVAAAWPHGDEREQVAQLYLRLYCVMLEKPEPLLAL